MSKSAEEYLQKVAMMEIPAVGSVGNPLSGQITVVAVSPASYQGPNIEGNGFYLKAHPDNSDTVWIGDNGTGAVAAATGFPMDPGETIFVSVENLNRLYFAADSAGDKVCWIRI